MPTPAINVAERTTTDGCVQHPSFFWIDEWQAIVGTVGSISTALTFSPASRHRSRRR
ncbi:MAG: hypothetical protein WKF45_10310 [Ilumatobacteraceae bacterium]